MFPSNGLITRRPASLPRVLDGASSPASSVLSGRYDFLPSLPPHFVAFAWRYHSSARISPARGRARPRAVFRSWSPGISGRDFSRWKRQDLLRSWGTPIVLLPCSPTPAGPAASGLFRCPGTAPTASTAEAPASIAFEAQSHGFGTGCLRFAGRVAPTPRKTRFRLLAKLFRAGLITRRVPSKGFTMYPTFDPPFPSST